MKQGLIKDCLIKICRNEEYCNRDKCPTCGWNPEVDEERKKMPLKKGKNGLWHK